MNEFLIDDQSLETQWRSLILFGKNSATYKFAFAKSLLELVDNETTVITLDDLSVPFSRSLIEHLKIHDKQGNATKSQFLEACRARIRNEISEEKLLEITKTKGFVNVVDAFQNLAGGLINKPFYEKDYSKHSKQIVITDELLSLKNQIQYENLDSEVNARWNLVETAWNIGIAPNLLEVQHDEFRSELFIETDIMDRIAITSSREALNGYQKGKCFYCCRDISINSGSNNICHVDHFLPHIHKKQHLPANINGVWNLVLSCSTCNGASEKGAKIPHIDFLSKLSKRNEFYITSKHPLSETIQNQTGNSTQDRKSFLNNHFQIAKDHNPTQYWKPTDPLPSIF